MQNKEIIKVTNNPLKKLISVIQNGLGSQNEDEIKKETENDNLAFDSTNRTQNRINHVESKRQQNLDYINFIAAEQLENENEVSEEPVEEDWTNRFFNYAQDISNDEMQKLWGRVLAGEVKRPKSFSLRTLEIIRNLSKEEAAVFMKFARFAISSGNTSFLLSFKKNKVLEDNYGLNYSDRLLLEELGLIAANELAFQMANTDNEKRQIVFILGNTCVIQEKLPKQPQHQIEVLVFTKIGQQLLKLVNVLPDLEYIQLLATNLNRKIGNVKYANILQYLPTGRINHTGLIDVPLTVIEREREQKRQEAQNKK
jgi:uncharacterized repeat protein (TIGR03899 family)